MKTRIIAAMIFISSATAFAEDANVEITSFRYADAPGRIAELCGKVTGEATAPIFVKALIDEQSNSPVIYNIIAGPEKTFCATVVTYWGTASATLWGQAPQPSVLVKAFATEVRK